MADWAGLQQHLLAEIAERLPSMESYERFGAVCRSWRAAAKSVNLNQTCFESPWLMLAENDEQKESGMREFCCVSLGNKIHTVFLPEATRKRCLSCKDWLFVVAEDEIHTSLLHPLTRVQIHLPKLDTFPDYDEFIDSCGGNLHFIEKVVLSGNPSLHSDCMIMVIWGLKQQLGFCKPGDTSWTPMVRHHGAGFDDIIYCNNKLYALDWRNRIIISDIHTSDPTHLYQVFDLALPEECSDKRYLVNFSGKFLVVHRQTTDLEEKGSYRTKKVKVFQVNIEDGTCLEVKNLGNRTLFLGYNSSFFIECSEYNNFKRNCIYFSDDLMEQYLSLAYDGLGTGGGKDMLIYHLWDERVEPLFDEIVCSVVTPPTWIGPSF